MKATSGQEALKLAWKYDFALVLLDVKMPGMDGFEVAKLMRGNTKTKNTPIIFLTANKEKSYLAKFREVGATGYLFKPIDPEMLKGKITTFLNLYRHKARVHG